MQPMPGQGCLPGFEQSVGRICFVQLLSNSRPHRTYCYGYTSLMKVASVSEAKNTLSALLDLVQAGETVVIVDRGTPVARLEAVSPSGEGLEPRLARLERSGLVRRGTGQSLAALKGPAPKLAPGHGTVALDALLEERRAGR